MAKKQSPHKKVKKLHMDRETEQKPSGFTLSDYRIIARFFELNIPELFDYDSLSKCAIEMHKRFMLKLDNERYQPIFKKLGLTDDRTQEEIISFKSPSDDVLNVFLAEHAGKYYKSGSSIVPSKLSLKQAMQNTLFVNIARFPMDISFESYTIEAELRNKLSVKSMGILEDILNPIYDLTQNYTVENLSFHNGAMSIGAPYHSEEMLRLIAASKKRDKTGTKRANRDAFNDAVFLEFKQTISYKVSLSATIRKVQQEHPEYLFDPADHYSSDVDKQEKTMKRLRKSYNIWKDKNTPLQR